jgi:hypothetical protein
MSVLIRGMDKIPEDGAVLIVKHDDNGKTYIKYAGMMGYSMEFVKIKEPHGDLIDRDVLKQDLSDFYTGIVTARRLIDMQDVVIEAEGAEE